MADSNLKHWIEAFRLRTLPLALSSILMGAFLANWQGLLRWDVFGLAIATTVFLQILSNLANDYGDSVHGADSVDREGPARAVQTGVISSAQMKRAIYVFGALALVAGIVLLIVAFGEDWKWLLGFLLLGIAAIYAAISYTAGGSPYGYKGLGDISVLLFFGIAGVFGSYFIHAKQLDWMVLLPAMSCGLLATGVLNVNNIRDIHSDKKAGKLSIPVRIGRSNAVIYHFTLLSLAMICAMVFAFLNMSSWVSFLFVLSFPLFVVNGLAVKNKKSAEALDPYLKQLALSTLVFVVLFGVGLNL